MTIHSFKEYVSNVIDHESEGRLGKTLENILLLTIFVSVMATVLETLPDLAIYHKVFWNIEVGCVTIFTVEYLARLWTANLKKRYEGADGLIRFIFTPLMVVDLLTILPFFLYLFLPISFLHSELLRFFRLIRILRFLRIGRYTQAFNRILNIIYRHKEDLVAIFFIIVIVISLLSTLMYFAEHSGRPEKFSSIPESIWWGIVTVSTIGYGDIYPVTVLGKFIGSITALVGVAIFALPTAVLGSSFYAEIHSEERKKIRELEKEVKRLETIMEERDIPLDTEAPEKKSIFSEWWPW
ncbi:MAG: ion transporter [Candidatus Peregrinibacteria bacterium]